MEQSVLERPQVRAKEPFRFYTRLNLIELTGLRARNLAELLDLIEVVPGSCIYYHTHQYLQEQLYLSGEPRNDFAYWVAEILREEKLGENLASINIARFSTIQSLRESLMQVIRHYLDANPSAKLRFSGEGDEFHFMKSMSFILPTPHVAWSLEEFAQELRKITFDSVYFHMIESRLRLEKTANDFSRWLEDLLGQKRIAERIAQLDPYTTSLTGLKESIVKIIEREAGT